ncbi:MAG: hypothetical protein M1816_000519 [Peltula sp. TS41687]|nr:MAG: hypothetical protein M1816_000519 [Peltula sp. TS41687]
MARERLDLIIIGAGWYGLIAATTYLKLAPNTKLVILDDGQSIGGVWNRERIYPNLFAQVGHGLFEYSFYPMNKEGLTPDRYISGETIHRYLNDFARDFDLVDRIRLETKVTKVQRLRTVGNDHGAGWRLTLESRGVVSTVETDKLIVASGVSSGPYIPDFPRTRFDKPIIHSSEIGSTLARIESSSVQNVVILGAAKSAYDAVFLMLKRGKKVNWVIKEDGSGPLAIMPPRLLGVFNTVDVMATRALACFSPAILQTSGFWYQVLQRSFIGRIFTQAFWRCLTYLAEHHAGYGKSENAEKLRPIPKGFGIFWANSGLGLASVPDFWKVFHAGDATVHRTSIASFSDGKVKLANGTNLSADLVVLCTGWTDNLSNFSHQLRAEIGLPSDADLDGRWTKLDRQADAQVDQLLPNLVSIPHETGQSERSVERRPWRLYRRLISPAMAEAGDRSIYFPGQIHSVFTPLVAELQALWGTAFLLGRLALPSVEKMHEEIAVWNSWTKKRYLTQGQKHAYSIYDYLAYIDTLARDLGIKTNRKSNPISEMFSSYRPSDYKGLIDEYLGTAKTTATRKTTEKYPSFDDDGKMAPPNLALSFNIKSMRIYSFLSVFFLLSLAIATFY